MDHEHQDREDVENWPYKAAIGEVKFELMDVTDSHLCYYPVIVAEKVSRFQMLIRDSKERMLYGRMVSKWNWNRWIIMKMSRVSPEMTKFSPPDMASIATMFAGNPNPV